jgi:hypothetical protein
MALTAVADWVHRSVRLVDDAPVGIVLAVDDTPYRPSAWLRFDHGRDYPAYRSVDLCDVVDVETSERGPVWGTGGPDAEHERWQARIKEREKEG